MKTKYLIAITLTFSFYSCNRMNNGESNSYNVNISDCNSSIPMSTIFDSVFIIPLESKNVPLIGQMETFQYFRDYIYILDKKKESVFIFTDKGKFLREVNRKGKGPGEYTDIKFFEINPYEGSIDIMSKTGSLYRYTSEGAFIESYSPPGDLRSASFFSNLNRDTIVFYTNSEPNRLTFFSKSRKSVISKDHKLPVYDLNSSFSPFYKYMGNTYLYEGFEPKRYLITNARLEEHYSIDFGENQFTTKDIPEFGTKKLYNEALQGELDKPFFWSNIENEDYIITTYRIKSDNCTIIIKKKSRKIISFRVLENGCIFPYGSTFNGTYLINVVPPYRISLFINEKLRSEFGINEKNQINEYSNPIIILYKLKQSL